MADGGLPVIEAVPARQVKAGGLVRAFFRARALNARFIALVQSVFDGFWLGVLSREDLDALGDEYYVGIAGKRSSPIDYTSADYNKRGLFEWERKAIESHFPPGGTIAVMAAGGGREVLALRQMSFMVQAWECQPELVAAANKLLVAEGFKPSVVDAPRDAVPTGLTTCDGIVVGWGAYMLIQGRHRRVALLRELRTLVDEGAPILLSFFTRRPGVTQLRISAAVGNLWRRLLRRERVELGDALEPIYVHRFLEEELASELAAAGFELKSFTVAPYGHAVARAAGTEITA